RARREAPGGKRVPRCAAGTASMIHQNHRRIPPRVKTLAPPRRTGEGRRLWLVLMQQNLDTWREELTRTKDCGGIRRSPAGPLAGDDGSVVERCPLPDHARVGGTNPRDAQPDRTGVE